MLISLSGVRGSGKDTIANHLVKEYGFKALSWADSLKDALSAIFGWDRAMLEGNNPQDRRKRSLPDEWWEKKLNWYNNPLYKEKHQRFTPLLAMTYVGTDIFRHYFDDNIWVNSLLKKIDNYPRKANIVVKDTRYPNEIESLKDKGAFFITSLRGEIKPYSLQASEVNILYRKGLISKKEREWRLRGIASLFNIHDSEISWQSYNESVLIPNDSDIKTLHIKVDEVLKTFIDREK